MARTNNFAAGTQFFEDFRFALSPAPERTLWWEWQAPGAGVLTCSTRGSTFDAQLLLVRGVDLAALQWLIGSWQRPEYALGRRLKLPVEAGTRYLIGVLAFWPADPGLVTLELAWEPVLGESVDPPVNDRLNQRIRLTGSPVSVAGSNRGATRETVDPLPSLPALAGPGRSVWWGWTAPAAGVYRVSTEGSDFDTTLSVLVESQPGVWTMLGSNDDATPYQLTSRFLLEATEGREYAIMVDGFGGHTGSINLRIESALEGGPPSNDDFRNRQALSGALSLVQGTTFQATSEPGEPTNPLSGFGAHSHTVWYSWQAEYEGCVRARVQSAGAPFTMVPRVTVYSGEHLEDLTLVGEGRLAGPGTVAAYWRADAGKAYAFQVNALQETDFTLAVDASENEELPRLRIAHHDDAPRLDLEVGSLGRRRLQLEASLDWQSWQTFGDLWVEGTMTLQLDPVDLPPGRFIRALAY